MSKVLRILRRVIIAASRGANTASQVILAAMLLILCMDITLRYLGIQPTRWGFGAVQYSFLWISILPAALAVYEKAHIRVGLLADRLKPKSKAILEILGLICVAAFSTIVAWFGFKMALHSLAVGTIVSGGIGYPLFWIEVWVPLAFVLVLAMCIIMTIEEVRKLIS